jgi:arsenical pump membrane protein
MRRGAVGKGMDVYLFLAGMMLLSELAREQGVFDWVAAASLKNAHGSATRLFVLVYVAGVAVTALLSNDATAVVMTPAVLASLKDTGKSDPAPYLFACAMTANAAGCLLPISNPANLVVFAQNMPPLGKWLEIFLLPSVAAIATVFVVLRWWFRRELRAGLGSVQETQQPLSASGRWVVAGLGVVTAVLLTCSALRVDLGAPTCACALAMVLVVCARGKRGGMGGRLARVVQGVSWSVLPLVAGLFCVVEAVSNAGLAHVAVGWMEQMAKLPHAAGVMGVGFGLGVIDNAVNNLPVGLMAGAAVQQSGVHGAQAYAALLGVDLGPNFSVTGSLATILWLMRVRHAGVKMSGASFLRVGAVAMPLSLAAALGVLLLMQR